MFNYASRRLLIAIPVLLGILFVSFILFQFLPGDPVRIMVGLEGASPEFIAQRRAELGLDEPLIVRYVLWLRELLQGNLGVSFRFRGMTVSQLLLERAGPTLMLTGAGVGVALLVAIPIGVVSALRQNGVFDYVSTTASMLAVSIPNFFLGMVGIYVFALQLGWLPTGGLRPPGVPPTFWLTIQHLILPVGILAAVLAGPYVRYTRQSMLEVLRLDYMTTAKAKGVGRFGVVIFHGLRTALGPLINVLAIQIPALLAGTVVIETIFSWPGTGRLVFESIASRDYPVILGVVMVSAVVVMLFNLLADLVTAALDPRLRL